MDAKLDLTSEKQELSSYFTRYKARHSQDAKPDTDNDETRTQNRGTQAGLLAEGRAADGGGGERGRVGHGHGEGDRRVAQDGEESGGCREVDHEGDRVLPDQDEAEPAPERGEGSPVDLAAVLGTGGRRRRRRLEGLVPEDRAPPHEGIGGAPDETDGDHLFYVADHLRLELVVRRG